VSVSNLAADALEDPSALVCPLISARGRGVLGERGRVHDQHREPFDRCVVRVRSSEPMCRWGRSRFAPP